MHLPAYAAALERDWSPDSAEAHASLHAACPAEAHLDRDIDTEVARKLLAEPTLLARLATPSGPQLADKP